jgi:pantoate kinase
MTAFAPANISLVFETYDAAPPQDRGSLGVGITLREGAQVRVRKSRGKAHSIYVDGRKWDFPTVLDVAEALAPSPVRVDIQAAFPFGCGFGMSGASALATAYALDALFALGRAREELGMIAHRAEVRNATGLGDVGGQFNGGIMIKTRKFQPLAVETLPLRTDSLHVFIHGPIRTADVITSREKLAFINAAGRAALQAISAAGPALTLDRLMDVSLEFASGAKLLTPRVEHTIQLAKEAGGHASMIMLGEAVVSTRPFPGSRAVRVLYPEAQA